MPRKPKNGAAPPPDDKPAYLPNVAEEVVVHYARKLRKLREKMEKVVAEYRAARKEAKADGVVLKELDFVMKLEDMEDPEIANKLNTAIHYARAIKAPIWSQLDFFVVPELTEEELMRRAQENGDRTARFGGAESDNPNSPGTPAWDAWATGFHEGAAVRLASSA